MQTAEPGHQAEGGIPCAECLLAFMLGIIDRLLVEVPVNNLHGPGRKLISQPEDRRLKVGDLGFPLVEGEALVLQGDVHIVLPLLEVVVVSLLG